MGVGWQGGPETAHGFQFFRWMMKEASSRK